MSKKVPISASKISLLDVFFSFPFILSQNIKQRQLARVFGNNVDSKHVFSLSSGIACFYLLLESLKQGTHKDEVIIPAYNAGSLVVAIQKAGLKPVLCEVSPLDFNLDIDYLPRIVNEKTLCIVGVHLFGIVFKNMQKIKEKYPKIILIEDAAQAMGSLMNNAPIGNLAYISFFSFNKGKNLPTFGGGLIATDNDQIAETLKQSLKILKGQTFKQRINIFTKMCALSLITRPYLYGAFYKMIHGFREVAPPADIETGLYCDLQASIALSGLKRQKELSKIRYTNGMRILMALEDEKQLMLPAIDQATKPAFNRLPIVFRDLKKRERVKINLWNAGFETSRMYIKPLHHMFDLGYKWGNFPNAVYMAGHLLTFPVHPLLKSKDIDTIITIIKKS